MKSKGGVIILAVMVALLSAWPVCAASQFSSKIEQLADKLTSSSSGEILSVDDDNRVFVNLGEKDSLHEGARFEVVRLGEAIIRGDKTYRKERPVGEIEITRVRPDMSWAKVSIAYAPIKPGDKVYQKRKKIKRVALTEFAYRDSFNDLTENIYERLATYFAQKGLQVVERSQLQKVLTEQKMAHSGIVDLGTAQKLGRLVGAEAVVLGSVSDLRDDIAVNARVIDVEKGLIMTAALVEMKKDPQIAALLASGSRGAVVASGMVGGRAARGATKNAGFFENDWFRIDVLSFRRQPEGLVMKLKLINRQKGTCTAFLADPREDCYLVSDSNNQYPYKDSELIHSMRFPPGVPRISSIMFRDVDKSGAKFIFSGRFYSSRGGFNVTIPNLRIQ